jgi:hypothetical protein
MVLPPFALILERRLVLGQDNFSVSLGHSLKMKLLVQPQLGVVFSHSPVRFLVSTGYSVIEDTTMEKWISLYDLT